MISTFFQKNKKRTSSHDESSSLLKGKSLNLKSTATGQAQTGASESKEVTQKMSNGSKMSKLKRMLSRSSQFLRVKTPVPESSDQSTATPSSSPQAVAPATINPAPVENKPLSKKEDLPQEKTNQDVKNIVLPKRSTIAKDNSAAGPSTSALHPLANFKNWPTEPRVPIRSVTPMIDELLAKIKNGEYDEYEPENPYGYYTPVPIKTN